MRDTILYDSALRLFGDHVSPQVLAAAEAGEWPAALWRAVDEAGYLDVLAEGPQGMVEAVAILRAAGHRAAPIPLPETMLARWLYAVSRVEPPAGPLSIALAEPGEPGQYTPVPWGGVAEAVAVISGSSFALMARDRLRFAPRISLAGESRDVLAAVENAITPTLPSPAIPGSSPERGGSEKGHIPLPNTISADYARGVGALMRAAQMAGAMEAALGLATTYANDRVQFGRPIGKFQAIQQQLALLAEEAAASLVAIESAAICFAEGRQSAEFALAAAKIRAGEAAGAVAEIAHQVHGAIGFTEEHSLHYLTRRLWSWRDEFGDEAYWAALLGRRIAASGGAGLWPLITTP
ncbi:MAG: acyl-CoA dehydrogenase family protein [Alphaproteobacteria bacterium]